MTACNKSGHEHDCDCCEGTAQRAPVAINNRSGLPAIDYRSGRYADYFDSMLAQLASAKRPALQNLKTRRVDDFSIALLDAAAATADVLTFYQERLANESYLRTAIERESVGELAKLLGYQLARGVSASTDLVFTVKEPNALPKSAPQPIATPEVQPVQLSAGIKVQSIPGPNEDPQTFETSESIEGRPEWNVMYPLQQVDQDIVATTRALLVDAPAEIAAGDRLIIAGPLDPPFPRPLRTALAHIDDVEELAETQSLRIGLRHSVGQDFRRSDQYALYTATQAAGIFGQTAVEWAALSEQAQADYLNLSLTQYRERIEQNPEVGLEWQGFTIFSPGQPLTNQPAPLVSEPTIASVMAAITETADRLEQTAGNAARRSLPTTAIDVAGTIGDLLAGTAQSLANANIGAALNTDTVGIKDAVMTLLNDLLPDPNLPSQPTSTTTLSTDVVAALNQLVTSDSALTNGLNTITSALNSIVDTSTLAANATNLANKVSPVNLLSQILTDIAVALAPIGNAGSDLVASLEQLRQTLGEAAVTAGMSRLVTSVAEAAINAELITTPQELNALVRYTNEVADQAIQYAPGNQLVTQFNNFMIAQDTAATNVANGKPLFDAIIDVGQHGALTGIAAANAAGVIAIHPLLTPLLVIDMAAAGAAQSAATAYSTALSRALDIAMQPVNVAQPAYRAGYSMLPDRIDLDRVYDNLRVGQFVVLSRSGTERVFRVTAVERTARTQYLISTQVTRLRLAGDGLGLFADGVRDTTVWIADQALQPAQLPLTTPISGRRVRLSGTVPNLQPGRKVVFSGEAQQTRDAVTESAIVKSSTHINDARVHASGPLTEIEFIDPLTNVFHRQSTRLFGNVAASTHGESTSEVLGSGDATLSFQSFVLKQAPLTYTSASTPGGSASSLRVWVNDIEWTEVPFFLGQPADAQIFTTRETAGGELQVRFGDGINGARLPTGSNNIRASYRKGVGMQGMVRKAQLSQAMTRPLGLEEVINPTSAIGAADPESLDDARNNAPLTVLTLDRAVSLQDYEDFARSFAGVAKAQAAWFWDGRQRVILITVAGSEGGDLAAGNPTISNLQSALRRYGDPHVPFSLVNFRPAYFRYSAAVRVQPGFQEEVVFEQLHASMRASFNFEQRQFAQPVVLSEVMKVLHTTEGVLAVDINALHRTDQPQGSLRQRLLADQAKLDAAGESIAAELLILDPDTAGSLVRLS